MADTAPLVPPRVVEAGYDFLNIMRAEGLSSSDITSILAGMLGAMVEREFGADAKERVAAVIDGIHGALFIPETRKELH